MSFSVRALLAVAICLSSLSALAGQILKVTSDGRRLAVTHPGDAPWAVNDKACIFRGRVQIACGEVTKVGKKGAILTLYTPNRRIVTTDTVKRFYTIRDPATLNSISVSEADPKVTKFYSITAGTDLSLHYLFPFVKFDALISDYFSIAGRVEYLSVAALNLRGFSTSFAINYYSTRWYQGFWAQAGAGFYLFSAESGTVSQTTLSPSLFTTLGWSVRMNGFLAGAALGIQYIAPIELAAITVSYSNIQPIALIDVGFTF